MGKYGSSFVIANSESCEVECMICKTCNNRIAGDYLIFYNYILQKVKIVLLFLN